MRIRASHFKKISVKLALFYALMFSLVLIALSVSVIYGIHYYLLEQACRDVDNSSVITAQAIEDYIREDEPLTDPDLLSESTVNSEIEVAIADKNGRIVNESADMDLSITSGFSKAEKIRVGNTRLAVKNSKIFYNGELLAYLQVTKNLAPEYSYLKITAFTIGVADIIGIGFSVIVGFIVSRKMLHPIDKITKAAKKISISDLNARIDVKDNDDELSHLAKTFNEMIERLKESFEQQNAFVSDASHELRTPISVIRGYIDLIDRWGKNDRKVLDEAISAIQNETRYMGDLVERLLFLARSDTGRLGLNKEHFYLHELISEMITEYGLIHQQQSIISKVDKDLTVFADIKLIKQALRALIDNGIKYSPRHGEITISADISSNEVFVSVKDRGIGIPKDKIDGIFERFYRVDSARERKTGGAGLGLSIVQTIVQVHGGRVTADSEPGKGTTVTITLPAD